MRVKILGEFSYQTFPETEDMLEFDEKDIEQIGITKKFNGDKIVDYVRPKDNTMEISQLKAKLQATDYKAIKFAEGLITAEEYEAIKQQRQEWRDEINRLEEEKKK